MSPLSQIPLPAWLADLPDVEREAAKTRFMLCLAAAYLEDRGSYSKLARALNVPVNTVHSARERGQISPEMAIAVESLLGRALFPRELFRPDLFTLPVED